MRKSEGYLNGVGDVRLFYRSWEIPRARAAFAVVPGLGDHSGRWEAFAELLTTFGYSTYALDVRGHGLSEGRRGHVTRFEVLLQDVDRFRREVQGLTDVGTPLFLLGHSMGGLIALRYLEEFEAGLAGGILSSPWLATAMPVPRWKANLANALNRIAPAVPIDSGLNPDHISRDLTVVQAYKDDPLVHSRITPRLFAEASIAMGLALQRSDRIKVPVLFMIAGTDKIVSTARSEAFARSLSARDVTIRVYTESYHEVLNEPDRTRALHDLRDWAAEHTRLPDRQASAAPRLHSLVDHALDENDDE